MTNAYLWTRFAELESFSLLFFYFGCLQKIFLIPLGLWSLFRPMQFVMNVTSTTPTVHLLRSLFLDFQFLFVAFNVISISSFSSLFLAQGKDEIDVHGIWMKFGKRKRFRFVHLVQSNPGFVKKGFGFLSSRFITSLWLHKFLNFRISSLCSVSWKFNDQDGLSWTRAGENLRGVKNAENAGSGSGKEQINCSCGICKECRFCGGIFVSKLNKFAKFMWENEKISEGSGYFPEIFDIFICHLRYRKTFRNTSWANKLDSVYCFFLKIFIIGA